METTPSAAEASPPEDTTPAQRAHVQRAPRHGDRHAEQHPATDVLVVGAGVVGASVAYHLARAGRAVTVVERGEVGGGVTSASFGWVGLAKSEAKAYAEPLRASAATEFARLRREDLAPFGLRECGAISWEPTEDETRAFVDEHRAIGHDIELIAREEVLAREPGLRTAPALAAYARGDAAVDPSSLARSLIAAAAAHGAHIMTETTVTELLRANGTVTGALTSRGTIRAATVVLAAGTATPALAATLDPAGGGAASPMLAVDASPSCLLTFATPEPLVRGILSTPEFELRQRDATTLLAAEDVPPGFSGDPTELAAETLAGIRSGIAGGAEVTLIDARIGDRPTPRSGTPLLGFAPGVAGLYVAVAHPGVILSAAIGRRAAEELA